MNTFLLIALIGQVAFAAYSSEFHSKKLPDEWSSSVKYKKDVDWFKRREIDPLNQFYEGIYRTRIDHFRPLNQQRVDFRYHVNANYYTDNAGPIYIYLKDAFDYTTRWIEEGLMVDIASQTGAALLTFDQRYFGANRLFDSVPTENLELLSVEQILADIAEFIRFVRQNLGNNQFSTVILWGSGYGGMLATFARIRFPHLVDATWSSSGMIELTIYSYGPYDLLPYTFNINDGGRCENLLIDAYRAIELYVQNGQGEDLQNRLTLCYPVETDNFADVSALYEHTVRAILQVLNVYHFNGVQAFCNDMEAIPGDPLASFARWLLYIYGEECFDHSYATLIEVYSNTEWDQIGTNSGRRQMYFLQCTQIGSFLLADSYTWLTGNVSLEYHRQKCEDVFGQSFTFNDTTAAISALTNEFNQVSTNVIYTNGNIDPFRYFGRLYDPSNSAVVLNIDYTLKSADLPSISMNDNVVLFQAKSVIIDYIKRWSNTTVRSN